MLLAALALLFASPISAMEQPRPPPEESNSESLDLEGFTAEPGWLNLNTSRVPSIPYPGQTVTVVVYALSNYYHSLMNPQFVCRFTSKTNPSQTFDSDYARLRPVAKGDPCFVIDCPLKSVTSWKIEERTAVVSVMYRSDSELKFIGKEGDNMLTFIDAWTSFEYDTNAGTILIRGESLNPDHEHSAKFVLENGNAFTVLARPTSLSEITFDLTKDVEDLEEKVSAQVKLFTTQGLVPYDGDKGGDTVILESPIKHEACDNHNLVNQPWRKISNTLQSPLYCDRNGAGILVDGWNRIDPSIGGRLPQSCPPTHRCGTHATGWLRDPPPVEKGVEEANTVCYHWSNNCCLWNSAVKVVNCGDFLVYHLPAPQHCSLSYCGDA
ncbi:uncharacterized protein [Oscarella lobularis]|uniref:uncharacterized protein n=1 Tax=Oscarella lobularis TaxID=121494 RepID=UPI0033139145